MLWDVYCRVIDNHGDLGVCWRLAADLATRGERVRLWVDDDAALVWMAPRGAPGVEVRAWPQGDAGVAPGEVVVEAFGCELPGSVVERMAQADAPPAWINLEYLSAEAYVERNHRLRSPQANGLRKTFFYPGFTPRTGGLLREPDLIERRAAFDASAWLAALGLARDEGERVVSLFCYEQPALPAMLEELGRRPTLLLATPGHAARQVSALLGPRLRRDALRAVLLPPLTQRDFDALLWSADLNLVRGEDSFVRAQWAGRPFVWQIYPQDDGAHLAKLAAFLDRFLGGAEPALASAVRALFAAWNAPSPPGPTAWPPSVDWDRHAAAWRASMQAQEDLTGQLLRFVTETR